MFNSSSGNTQKKKKKEAQIDSSIPEKGRLRDLTL